MTVPTHPTSPATPGARPGHPFRLGVCVFVSLVLGQTVLRAVLLAAFGPSGATWDAVVQVFGIGLLLDGLGAAVLTLPLLAGLALARERWLRRAGFRSAIAVGLGVAAGIQVFLFSAEFFFFEEFRSRFNTVAVDYVLYPHEVFVNVWESYPVVPVVGAFATIWGVSNEDLYDTVFFGRDLLHSEPERARVWLHHNRDIGLYTPGALAILSLQQATEFFRGDPRAAPPVEITEPTPAELQLQHTAMAVFQVADDLYHRGAYRVADPTGTPPLSALTAGPLRTPDAAAHPTRSGSP